MLSETWMKVIAKFKCNVKDLPKFPSVPCDWALVVVQGCSLCRFVRTLFANTYNKRSSSSESVCMCTKGTKIPEGTKSYAVSLVFRSDDKTLTDNTGGQTDG